METNKYKELGTSLSGYAETGPYSCKNCIHKVEEYCTHPVIVADPEIKNKKSKEGVEIDIENGCCRFVRPDESKRVSYHPLLRVIQSKT